jgi:hypothetical protein
MWTFRYNARNPSKEGTNQQKHSLNRYPKLIHWTHTINGTYLGSMPLWGPLVSPTSHGLEPWRVSEPHKPVVA